MTQKRPKKATAGAGKNAPPPMPKAGGSYLREPDGSLNRVEHTVEAPPRAQSVKED